MLEERSSIRNIKKGWRLVGYDIIDGRIMNGNKKKTNALKKKEKIERKRKHKERRLRK